jgi:hypothetical protein
MLVPLQYTYFIGATVSLIVWIILFFHRKDLRKEMITMSILFAIIGLFSEYLWWTKDWWRPQTITGTIIGIEDFLLGFTNGGIAAVLYEELFKKRIYKYKSRNHNLSTALIVICTYLILGFSFHILKLNSFMATTIAYITAGGIFIFLRKDLIWDAILTGLCGVIASIPIYLLLEYLSPNFIENTWMQSSLTGINFLKIPIEDLIFYFLAGFSISPIYLYWKNEKLKKIPH